MHKLTEKELSILEEIEMSGNSSAKDLCKKLRLKESTLRYHLRKLNDHGLIRMVPKIDFEALRLKRYRILLSLSNECGLNGEAALEAIRPFVFAARIELLSGEYSHAVGLVVRSKKELKEALSALSDTIDGEVKDKRVLQVEETTFLGRSYLFSKRRDLTFDKSADDEIIIDEKERAILKCLFNFPYKTRTQVARALAISPSTLDYKIAKMERVGVISKWYIEINSSALGIDRYRLHLSLKSLSSAERDSVVGKLTSNPNIVKLSLLLGVFDLSLTIEARNANEYLQVKEEIFRKVNGNLCSSTSLQVLREMDYFSLATVGNGYLKIAA